MHELMLLMAKALPEDKLIEQIEEAITEHKILKTEETKQRLHMYCHLLLTKDVIADNGIEKVMRDMTNLKAMHERFNSNG